MLIKILKYTVTIVIGLYAFTCGTLYLYQDNLLFFPRKDNSELVRQLGQNTNLKHLTLTTPDGVVLDGWQQVTPGKTTSILYFDGNASNITEFVGNYSLSGANVIAFNYRGYGSSTGKPSETSILQDTLFIYDTLVKDGTINPDRTYIMGRSLGTGVATYLASQRATQGVILITPYDSIESVAKETFSLFPVSLLIRNKFPSIEFAKVKNNSALVIYGGKDTTIPNAHTERLMQAWNGSVQKLFLPQADHDYILEDKKVWESIEDFIK